jgi:hypothetical protein
MAAHFPPVAHTVLMPQDVVLRSSPELIVGEIIKELAEYFRREAGSELAQHVDFTRHRLCTDDICLRDGRPLYYSWFAHFLRDFNNCGRVSGATEVPHGRDPDHCQ